MNCRSIPRTSHRYSCSFARTVLSESLEDFPEGRYAAFQCFEVFLRDHEHIHGRARPNRRVPRHVVKQSHFPKIIAGTERRDVSLIAVGFPQDIAFSALDHVQVISQIALEEDDLSRFKMLSGDTGVAHNPHLHEIGRKQQNKKPIQSNPYLLAQAWKLRQIDGPPQEPSKKARNADSQNFRHPRIVAQRPKFPEPFEGKRRARSSANRRSDVLGYRIRLASCMLSGGRRPLAGDRGDRGTITQRPDATLIAHKLKVCIDLQAPALFLTIEFVQHKGIEDGALETIVLVGISRP